MHGCRNSGRGDYTGRANSRGGTGAKPRGRRNRPAAARPNRGGSGPALSAASGCPSCSVGNPRTSVGRAPGSQATISHAQAPEHAPGAGKEYPEFGGRPAAPDYAILKQTLKEAGPPADKEMAYFYSLLFRGVMVMDHSSARDILCIAGGTGFPGWSRPRCGSWAAGLRASTCTATRTKTPGPGCPPDPPDPRLPRRSDPPPRPQPLRPSARPVPRRRPAPRSPQTGPAPRPA